MPSDRAAIDPLPDRIERVGFRPCVTVDSAVLHKWERTTINARRSSD
jgi:hypothetical protein